LTHWIIQFGNLAESRSHTDYTALVETEAIQHSGGHAVSPTAGQVVDIGRQYVRHISL
jgi:hypothetical protein